MKKLSILMLILLIGLLVFSCGPSPQEKYAAKIVEDVIGGIPNALYNGNFSGFENMMKQTKQGEENITIDFDDNINIDPEDKAEGQVIITLVTEPSFDNTLELGDGFGTPVEDLNVDSTTGEVTPVFPAVSPFTWDDVNKTIITDESYFYTLIGIDDPNGTNPQDTLIDFDGAGLNNLITTLNDEVIASGNSIGSSLEISIEYVNFRIKETMEYNLTGTVSYSITVGAGIRLQSNFDGNSAVNIDISYPDNTSAPAPSANVNGSITPGFRLGWDLNVTSTGFTVTPTDGTDPSTVDMDIVVEGNYTMLITASGEFIIEEVSGEPELTVNNFDLMADSTDEVTTSGTVTVDGQPVDPSSAQPITAMMQPLFDIMNEIEEDLDQIVDDINNNM